RAAADRAALAALRRVRAVRDGHVPVLPAAVEGGLREGGGRGAARLGRAAPARAAPQAGEASRAAHRRTGRHPRAGRQHRDPLPDRLPDLLPRVPAARAPADRAERGGVPGHRRRRGGHRSEEHTSELQSRENLVCRLLLEKKKKKYKTLTTEG